MMGIHANIARHNISLSLPPSPLPILFFFQDLMGTLTHSITRPTEFLLKLSDLNSDFTDPELS